jgi:hypothetical protein
MMFQSPEGTRLSERVEARNRLLQAYDEEVTIRRTLPQASRTGGFQAAEEKTRGKTTGQPSFLPASAKRRPYGVAVGCAAGAGEEAGDA